MTSTTAGVAGKSSSAGGVLFKSFGAVYLVFLVLPVLALVFTSSPGALLHAFKNPLVWPAVKISVVTTAISSAVAIVMGTPLAWMLGRSRKTWTRWVESALELPIVMPPAVVGVALLLTYGRRGWFGGIFRSIGWDPAFTAVAVIFAQLVVASPFYVQSATAAFRRIDEELLVVGRSLGASRLRVFFRIAVPVAMPGLINGAALMWARALGEFGATLLFAGNLTGRTQTLPLAIYTALESDVRVAQAISVLLVGIAIGLLVLLRGPLSTRLMGRRGARRDQLGGEA